MLNPSMGINYTFSANSKLSFSTGYTTSIGDMMTLLTEPMKVFCEYLMLVVEKSVWSVLKLRLSTSEQMFNLNATF